jgi:hypothetical protein
MAPTSRPHRLAIGAAAVVAALGSMAGCGTSGEDSATTTTKAPAATTTTAATTSTEATTTTTAPPTTTAVPGAARWIGVTWEAGPQGGAPIVDGAPIDLSSTTGLCRTSTCGRSLDLLTGQPTGGAPAPGPYVLWANRLVDRTSDGRPIWTITDALDLELAESAGIYVCAPTSDPMVQVVGFGPADPGTADSITPDAVWDVDASGSIVTPDPGGYRCEVGQD